MAKPKLHLDADISIVSLERALRQRGHDVTRTPTAGIPLDASDEHQLLVASAQGRIVATFNVRDFVRLADAYPSHAGIVLAHQRSWRLAELIDTLDRMLATTDSDQWIGQVRWLNMWRR